MATNKQRDTPAQRDRTTIALDIQELADVTTRAGADVAMPGEEASGADVAPVGDAAPPAADVAHGPMAATGAPETAIGSGAVAPDVETPVVEAPVNEAPVNEARMIEVAAERTAEAAVPSAEALATPEPPSIAEPPSAPVTPPEASPVEPAAASPRAGAADPGATKEIPVASVARREANAEPVPAFADEAQADVEAEWSLADKPTIFLPPMARTQRPAFLETGETPAWPPRPGQAANPSAPAANLSRPVTPSGTGPMSRPLTPPAAGPMSRPLTPPPGAPSSRQFNPTVPMSRPLTPPGTGPTSRPLTPPRPGGTGQPAMGQPLAGYGPVSRPLTPPPTRPLAGTGALGGAAAMAGAIAGAMAGGHGAMAAPSGVPPTAPQTSPPTNTLRSMIRPAPGQERIPSPTGRPAAGTWPANSDPRIRRLEELRRQRLAQIAGQHAGQHAAGENAPVAQMVRQWWTDLMPGMRKALHSQHEARASGVYPMPATETAVTGRLGDAFGRLTAAVRDMSERAQSATGPTIKGIHDRAEHAAQALVERFEGSPTRQQAPLLGPGRLAVFFRQGVTVGDAQRLLVATRARPMRLIPRRHGFLALVPPGNESSIGEQLRQHPYVRDVVYLEYDALGQALPPR